MRGGVLESQGSRARDNVPVNRLQCAGCHDLTGPQPSLVLAFDLGSLALWGGLYKPCDSPGLTQEPRLAVHFFAALWRGVLEKEGR